MVRVASISREDAEAILDGFTDGSMALRKKLEGLLRDKGHAAWLIVSTPILSKPPQASIRRPREISTLSTGT